MSKVKYSKDSKKKSSPFFALVPDGNSLVAIFSGSRTVVDRLKKNSRDHKKVFSTNNN